MAKYLDELIDRYERGEIDAYSVCDNIERITKKEEYINDVNSNRLKEKMADKYCYLRYSQSPEEIILGWERSETILHFLDWIRSILSEKDWYVFSQYTLHKVTREKLANSLGVKRQSVDFRLKKVNKMIKSAIPYYNEQFGDIRAYLLED